MKRDVINGYEYQIFEESELEAARAAEAQGNSRVRIATTCDSCGGSIEARIADIDNRAEEPIVHSENYHQSLPD